MLYMIIQIQRDTAHDHRQMFQSIDIQRICPLDRSYSLYDQSAELNKHLQDQLE